MDQEDMSDKEWIKEILRRFGPLTVQQIRRTMGRNRLNTASITQLINNDEEIVEKDRQKIRYGNAQVSIWGLKKDEG